MKVSFLTFSQNAKILSLGCDDIWLRQRTFKRGLTVHVISEKKLREFWKLHPDAETPLRAWNRVTEQSVWRSFASLRETFAHADQVGRCTVFNIGGNKYRLIVVIHFNREKVYIRHVLTHSEYDQGKWKEGCTCP